MKLVLNDLGLLGGRAVLDEIRSTSNLVTPDIDGFLGYVRKSYDSGWITNNGPMVREMEERLAALHGVSECVATCNGLWALVLCIHTLALTNRNEIIMPSLTYRRMADIAAWLDMVPHFCDVDEDTLGISPVSIQSCLNEQTALILAAHPIVNLADLDGLETVAQTSEIPLLIDSVEAAAAEYSGREVGSFGNAEVFSMHASKLLNAFEAGYITTNDQGLAEELRLKRAFGFHGPDTVKTFGLNAKLNEVHAAMALACLDDLDSQIARNREQYLLYEELLDEIPGMNLVKYSLTERRGFKNILVRLDPAWPLTRSQTLEILHAENMLARPYYSPPLHDKVTVYDTIAGGLPITDRLKDQFMLLPSGAFLSQQEVRDICSFLNWLQDNGAAIRSVLESENG